MGNSIQKLAFPVPNPPTPFENSQNYRFINLKNGGKIPVLYLPFQGSKKILIFSHGNGCDLGNIEEYLNFLSRELKVSVIGYEYLGYGFSEYPEDFSSLSSSSGFGSKFPSEEGCYQSLWATINWARKSLKYSTSDIILMGQSIGSGPTCEVGSKLKKPCYGVILVTPFKSVVKVVTESSLGYFLDFFKNENKVEKILAPVLIIHGTNDEVVPFDHSKCLMEKLYKKNGKEQHPPLWIEGAKHNDITFFSEYHSGIAKFLTS